MKGFIFLILVIVNVVICINNYNDKRYGWAIFNAVSATLCGVVVLLELVS